MITKIKIGRLHGLPHFAFFIIYLFLLWSCSSDSGGSHDSTPDEPPDDNIPHITEFSVIPSTIESARIGQTFQLKVTAVIDGVVTDLTNAATGTTYDSSDNTVASIGSNGLVECYASGRADISVHQDESTLMVPVTVISEPAPELTAVSGFICGTVYDTESKAVLPIARVTARNVDGVVFTDENGRFRFPTPDMGTYFITVEKEGYTYGQRSATVESTRPVGVDPIYIKPLDGAETVVAAGGGQHVSADGEVEIDIPAGAVNEAITVRTTNYDYEEELPGPLPEKTDFTYCVHFYPELTTFEKPVTVRVENSLGFSPGTKIPVGIYRKDEGRWRHETIATVTADGRWVTYTTQHFSAHDINFYQRTLNQNTKAPGLNEVKSISDAPVNSQDDKCRSVKGGSRVDVRDGELGLTHDLPTYKSMDRLRGLRLAYNSRSAAPSALVGMDYDFQEDSEEWEPLGHTVEVRVGGQSERFSFAKADGPCRFSYLWQPEAEGDAAVPTGSYTYQMDLSNDYAVNYWTSLEFAGTIVEETDVPGRQLARRIASFTPGRVVIRNLAESSFGAGWGLMSVQRLFRDPDGFAMILEGSGATATFGGGLVYDSIPGPDGDPDLSASGIDYPRGLAFDAWGNIIVTDHENHVWRIDPNKNISRIAGDGTAESSGDGGPAVDARLNDPHGVAVDEAGNIFIAEITGNRIRRIDTNGIITTIAGTGASGFSGDGGPATEAKFNWPIDLALDRDGNIYVADANNHRIRKIDSSGTITTVVGGGWSSAEGIPATQGIIQGPTGVSVDKNGTIYIACQLSPRRVRRVDPDGNIYNATPEYSSGVMDVVVGKDGNVYFHGMGPSWIGRINTDGTVVSIAGGGETAGAEGDPAANTALPAGFFHIVPDWNGRICFGANDHKIWRLKPSTAITGFEAQGQSGDFSTLRSGENGEASRIYPSGTSVYFNAQGYQTKITDKNQNTTFYEWEGDSPRLTRITDPAGLETQLFYDAQGRITSIVDPAGRETRFTVDGNNNLVRIENPDSGVRNFDYDDRHRLVKRIEPMNETTEYEFDAYGALVHVMLPDGAERSFSSVFSGPLLNALDAGRHPWEASAPAFSPDDAKESVVDASGAEHIYKTNTFGNRTLIQDPLGNQTRYERDDNNLPTLITLPDNAVIQNTYNDQGRLTQTIDPENGRSEYSYGGPFGAVTSALDANNVVTRFEYDANGNMTRTVFADQTDDQRAFVCNYDSHGLLTEVIDDVSRTTFYEYTPEGLVSEVIDPLNRSLRFEYNAAGYPVAVYDADNNSWRLEYDDMGRVTASFDPLGNARRITYDLSGRVTSHITPGGAETRFEYDMMGRVVKITDPLGNEALMTYDGEGFVTRAQQPDGRVLRYTFDGAHQLTRVVAYAGAAEGDPGSDDMVTLYEYNPRGQVSAVSDGVGSRWKFDYDKLGRMTRRTNPMANITTFAYDPLGYLLSVKDPRGRTTAMTYDAFGLLTEISDDLGMLSSRTYNEAGLPTASMDATGKEVQFTYDDAGQLTSIIDEASGVTRYFYDVRGLIEKIQDPAGRELSFEYDVLGRQTARIDNLGNRTDFTLDVDGNVTTFTDALGRKTAFQRDTLGRVVKTTYQDGSFETLEYDAVGRPTRRVLADGRTFAWHYDQLGRLVSEDGPGDEDAAYAYYPDGSLYSASNANSSITFMYDAAKRIVSREEDGLETVFSYNTAGGIADSVYPSGLETRHSLDLRGRLTQVDVNGATAFQWDYDALNQPVTRHGANGIDTTFSWSDRGELLDLRHGDTLWRTQYGYDVSGLPITARDTVRSDQSMRYSLDDIQRLTEAVQGEMNGDGTIPSPVADLSFAYDDVGNLLEREENGTVTSFAYDQLYRLSAAGGETYEFDEAGNLTGDGDRTYTYDFQGRLVGVFRKSDNAELLKIGYNALGERVLTRTPEGETRHVVIGGMTIEERGNDGSPERSFVYGGSFQEPLLLITGAQQYTYHQNRLADVVALTNESGDLVERYTYDPYGVVSRFDGAGTGMETSSVDNPFYFNAQRLDKIGWYHFRYRSYAPDLGRFVSRDPAGYSAGASLYPYALSNPTAFTDPQGDIVPVIILGALVGANVGLWGYNASHSCGNPLDPASYRNSDFNGAEQLQYGAAGAAAGGVSTAAFGATASYLAGSAGFSFFGSYVTAGAVSGVAGTAASDVVMLEASSPEEYAQSAAFGGALSGAGYGLSRIATSGVLLNAVEEINPKAAFALGSEVLNPANTSVGYAGRVNLKSQFTKNIFRKGSTSGTPTPTALKKDIDVAVDGVMTQEQKVAGAVKINQNAGAELLDTHPTHGLLSEMTPANLVLDAVASAKSGELRFVVMRTMDLFKNGGTVVKPSTGEFKDVVGRAVLEISNPMQYFSGFASPVYGSR